MTDLMIVRSVLALIFAAGIGSDSFGIKQDGPLHLEMLAVCVFVDAAGTETLCRSLVLPFADLVISDFSFPLFIEIWREPDQHILHPRQIINDPTVSAVFYFVGNATKLTQG